VMSRCTRDAGSYVVRQLDDASVEWRDATAVPRGVCPPACDVHLRLQINVCD